MGCILEALCCCDDLKKLVQNFYEKSHFSEENIIFTLKQMFDVIEKKKKEISFISCNYYYYYFCANSPKEIFVWLWKKIEDSSTEMKVNLFY